MNRIIVAPVALASLFVFSVVYAVLSPGASTARARPAESPPAAPVQLDRALLEARANVKAARALGMGSPRVLLGTEELELALRAGGFAADPEEQVRLLLVARLIRDVGRACARGEGERRLADERITEEDFRFLLGAVEARLAREAAREPLTRPTSYECTRLRQFRGLGFDEAVRSLFE